MGMPPQSMHPVMVERDTSPPEQREELEVWSLKLHLLHCNIVLLEENATAPSEWWLQPMQQPGVHGHGPGAQGPAARATRAATGSTTRHSAPVEPEIAGLTASHLSIDFQRLKLMLRQTTVESSMALEVPHAAAYECLAVTRAASPSVAIPAPRRAGAHANAAPLFNRHALVQFESVSAPNAQTGHELSSFLESAYRAVNPHFTMSVRSCVNPTDVLRPDASTGAAVPAVVDHGFLTEDAVSERSAMRSVPEEKYRSDVDMDDDDSYRVTSRARPSNHVTAAAHDRQHAHNDWLNQKTEVIFAPVLFDVDLRLFERLSALVTALNGLTSSESLSDSVGFSSHTDDRSSLQSFPQPVYRVSLDPVPPPLHQQPHHYPFRTVPIGGMSDIPLDDAILPPGPPPVTFPQRPQRELRIRASTISVQISFPDASATTAAVQHRHASPAGHALDARGVLRREQVLLQLHDMVTSTRGSIEDAATGLVQHAAPEDVEWQIDFRDLTGILLYPSTLPAAARVSESDLIRKTIVVAGSGLSFSSDDTKSRAGGGPSGNVTRAQPAGPGTAGTVGGTIRVLSRQEAIAPKGAVFRPVYGGAGGDQNGGSATGDPLLSRTQSGASSLPEQFFQALPSVKVWEAVPEVTEPASSARGGASGGRPVM